jgi:hypothetical protein
MQSIAEVHNVNSRSFFSREQLAKRVRCKRLHTLASLISIEKVEPQCSKRRLNLISPEEPARLRASDDLHLSAASEHVHKFNLFPPRCIEFAQDQENPRKPFSTQG